jgi:hypothetical protein
MSRRLFYILGFGALMLFDTLTQVFLKLASNHAGEFAGLAVVRIFEAGNYGASVPEKGRYFLRGLKEIQRKHPEVGDVDGLGLALRMEMCEADGYTPNRRLADGMFQLASPGGCSLATRPSDWFSPSAAITRTSLPWRRLWKFPRRRWTRPSAPWMRSLHKPNRRATDYFETG